MAAQNNHMPEVRQSAFAAEVSEAGVLRGVASVTGVMDAYSSVILPGAFREAIPGFLERGHVCWNHDWSRWIGMPTRAMEEGNRLVVEAEFYEDEDSQTARAKLTSRMKRNLKTDFSITFWVDWEEAMSFDSGEKLMRYVQSLGYDMSMLDPDIRQHDGYCWIIPKVQRLGEFGPVMTGATPGAEATGIRSLNDLRDGSLAGTSLENHLEIALAAIQGATARLQDVETHRHADGRLVSPMRVQQARALRDVLARIIDDNSPIDVEWRRLQMEADVLLSGL